MSFTKLIRFIITDLFVTALMLTFVFGLWAVCLFLAPEHRVKLMLLSIFIFVFIRGKFSIKKQLTN